MHRFVTDVNYYKASINMIQYHAHDAYNRFVSRVYGKFSSMNSYFKFSRFAFNFPIEVLYNTIHSILL